jgi:retron-type reverse transcriptase
MGKKYRNLYQDMVSLENLNRAFVRAGEGKKGSHGFLVFNEHAQSRIVALHEALVEQRWQPDPLRKFIVFEPKRREIGAPTFSDRVVHHALVSKVDPIFDATFLPWSFACRNGKGTHAGVAFVQAQLRKHQFTHFLKTDFRSYFPSIERTILHQQFARKISDPQVLDLFGRIIPTTGTGVPIGALTSQLAANVYGNVLDHYLHHELKVTFARYMDDVVVLGNDPAQLREVKIAIEEFARDNMHLEISRWQASPISRGINFLGYRIWPTHKLLRKSSVTRAKRKIKNFTEENDLQSLTQFVGSWKGHAAMADSANLRRWLNNEYQVAQSLAIVKQRPRPTRLSMLSNLIKPTP